MSFSYKTLSSNDITLTSYIANKQWEVNNSIFSQNGITIYMGENTPITATSPFDPINDPQNPNGNYRRLIYDSIKFLYYQNYISGYNSGDFFHSSSYFNYEQSTLESGSIRNFPTSEGNRILVLSIDQNIYGSGLSPNSFNISGSQGDFYIIDDGEGNLFDNINYDYVGNIFYSQGLVVITNKDYFCAIGDIYPVAVNDYLTYLNTTTPPSLNIISNDICDCFSILKGSFFSSSISGYTFPNFTYSTSSGIINITPNQISMIPGHYKLGYTVSSSEGLGSNLGIIDLNITSKPLEISSITSSLKCYGNSTLTPVTFSINYGVPYYSYSLDNGITYTGVNSLYNVTISGSVTASNNNIIYIKDYLGDVVTSSFSTWYPEITAYTQITKLPCSTTSQNGIIYVSSSTAISASIGSTRLRLPNSFSSIGTGSIVLGLTSSFGCTTSSIIQVGVYPALTASVTQSNVSCYGGNNGYLEVNFTNVIDNSLVFLTDPTSSLIYNGIPINDFLNNSVTASNLGTGSYSLQLIVSDAVTQCQNYTSSFNITSSSPILFNVTASYINSCSNQIIFNTTGGNGTYIYYAVNTGSNIQYSSTISPLDLGSTNGGTFSTFVIDSNNCVSTSSLLNVYGRTYIYSGSSCEII